MKSDSSIQAHDSTSAIVSKQLQGAWRKECHNAKMQSYNTEVVCGDERAGGSGRLSVQRTGMEHV